MMTSVSQLLRKAAPLWSHSSGSTLLLMLPTKIIRSQRPFLFMISASTSTMGILSCVLSTDCSNENDTSKSDSTSSNFSATLVGRERFNDSVSSTSWFHSLHNYHSNHNRFTYCDSATASSASSYTSLLSSKVGPVESSLSSSRFNTGSDERHMPSDANAHGEDHTTTTKAKVVATTASVHTGNSTTTTKSNIQRQV